MRRPLGRRLPAALALARAARQPLAQRLHLPAQAREFIGKFEHRLVLLGHMPLEVGDLLLEALNAFVQRESGIGCRRLRPP